jgi:hypothetical protein
MLDLWALSPGDVIVRDNVGAMDEDVPLMVIACHPDTSTGYGVLYRVLALYMVASGFPHLETIEIDAIDAPHYRWLIRLHDPQGAKRTLPKVQ